MVKHYCDGVIVELLHLPTSLGFTETGKVDCYVVVPRIGNLVHYFKHIPGKDNAPTGLKGGFDFLPETLFRHILSHHGNFLRRQERVIHGLEGPGTPGVVLRLHGVSPKLVEVILAVRRTDEQRSAFCSGEGGADNHLPHLFLHKGVLVHYDVAKADPTQAVGTVCTLDRDASTVDQREDALVLVFLSNEL